MDKDVAEIVCTKATMLGGVFHRTSSTGKWICTDEPITYWIEGHWHLKHNAAVDFLASKGFGVQDDGALTPLKRNHVD